MGKKVLGRYAQGYVYSEIYCQVRRCFYRIRSTGQASSDAGEGVRLIKVIVHDFIPSLFKHFASKDVTIDPKQT